MRKACVATAFESFAGRGPGDEHVIIYTDEGDEVPIKVTRDRIGALISTLVDALEGTENTR